MIQRKEKALEKEKFKNYHKQYDSALPKAKAYTSLVNVLCTLIMCNDINTQIFKLTLEYKRWHQSQQIQPMQTIHHDSLKKKQLETTFRLFVRKCVNYTLGLDSSTEIYPENLQLPSCLYETTAKQENDIIYFCFQSGKCFEKNYKQSTRRLYMG